MFNFIKNLFTDKEKSAKLLQDVQYVTREHFNRNPDGITAIIVGLHLVTVKDTPNELEITYVVSRPGLFIGSKGINITALKNCLADVLGRNIKLLVVEYDPLTVMRRAELKLTQGVQGVVMKKVKITSIAQMKRKE